MHLSDGRVRKRRKSWHKEGHTHELTFTCYHRIPMLAKDRVRRWLVDALDRARKKIGFEVWAYVIMPDHAHVLVWPKHAQATTGRMLHAIKQPTAVRAIRWLRTNSPAFLERLRHDLPGGEVQYRLWEVGGGYDRNMWTADAIWNAVSYIHENPVRKRLVEKAADWRWSSAAWYTGQRDVPLQIDRKPPVRREVKIV
jgi:putative transposase